MLSSRISTSFSRAASAAARGRPSVLSQVVRPTASTLQDFGRTRNTIRSITTDAQKLNTPLRDLDAEVSSIVEAEKLRQVHCCNLIASENFASRGVLDALGSVMQNKYSEGYPGARYYGGNEQIDEMERLCQRRALETYNLDPEKWGVNVQCYSGSPANFAVYTALVPTHGRIMGLDLPHGGHLTHGFQTDTKKISMVSKFWETLPYRLNVETGVINYDEVQFLAQRFRPKLIIAGCTAYSRIVDTPRFREICDEVGAILHYDMAHISGLVAGGVVPSPFDYADVITTTTHKSLRGPRGSMIFYRKGQKGVTKKGEAVMYDLENKITETVFPGLQGGPHNHSITALAVALKQAQTEEFKTYQKQIIAYDYQKQIMRRTWLIDLVRDGELPLPVEVRTPSDSLNNSKAFADKLMALGFDIVSGGTDNHMSLVDLSSKGVSGAKGERICEMVNIVCNKNTVPKDKSPMNPSGLRVGTPAMTSRGFVEKDFEQIAIFMDRAVNLAATLQKQAPSNKLTDFTQFIIETQPAEVAALKQEVADFCGGFDAIGV